MRHINPAKTNQLPCQPGRKINIYWSSYRDLNFIINSARTPGLFCFAFCGLSSSGRYRSSKPVIFDLRSNGFQQSVIECRMNFDAMRCYAADFGTPKNSSWLTLLAVPGQVPSCALSLPCHRLVSITHQLRLVGDRERINYRKVLHIYANPFGCDWIS